MHFIWGWSLSYSGVHREYSVEILVSPRLGDLEKFFQVEKTGVVFLRFGVSGRKPLAAVFVSPPNNSEFSDLIESLPRSHTILYSTVKFFSSYPSFLGVGVRAQGQP